MDLRFCSNPTSRSPWPIVGAFLTTLLAMPAQARTDDFVIPATPLTSGTAVPPNLMLLFDDSGSMLFNFLVAPSLEGRRIQTSDGRIKLLPLDSPTSGGHAALATANANTLAYDPRVTYEPWTLADGTSMPAMTPDSVPSSPAGLTGQISLYQQKATKWRPWFYVMRFNTNDPNLLSDFALYDLYQLTGPSTAVKCAIGKKIPGTDTWMHPGGDGKNWPRGDCVPIHSFVWSSPEHGMIHRTIEEEWRNYANWFAYHRTRMKMAKAAVSRVFSTLGSDVRVGYSNLGKSWEKNSRLDIPVGTNGGLFIGQNRKAWFDRLFQQIMVRDDTPLRSSLSRMGEYFKSRDATGPWGPEAPEQQLACRQNFTILATDGEWRAESFPENPGNSDGTNGQRIFSPDGRSFQYVAGPPYADIYSTTLADVAMKYWKEDLRPDLDNIVPSSSADPAFWQHMVTFTISIGLRGALNPSEDMPALIAGTKQWPNPHTENRHRIDDLFHASVNGRGSYVSASDPMALKQGLEDALMTIGQRTTGSGTNLAFDSNTLEVGGRSFVASYLPGAWSGDLKAYVMTPAGIGHELAWSAAEGIPLPERRLLYTSARPGQLGQRQAESFPTPEQSALLTDEVAAWIRGDRSREGGRLRARESLLGDIVHSSPVHVKTANAEAVFVGANDGMLHAFDATNGKELFAYIPGLLDVGELKALSQDKSFRHRYFVDGPTTVARTNPGDGVVLVGGLGRGGRGVYGLSLDLAVPKLAPSSWEFKDDDMGLVLSRPQLARMRAGSGAPDTVLVANGINSPAGKAALYVLDLATGKLVDKIVVGQETGNGLSTPTLLDVNGDGRIDRAYAGDMRGNVWRFDLSRGPGQWNASKIFTATDVSGRRQPVTGGIGVALHPSTRHPWLFFGTGSYITVADATSVSTQSWYGVEDGGSAVSRGHLLIRRIASTGTVGGRAVRTFEKARPGDMLGKLGWVIDLRTPGTDPDGERMVGESQHIVGGRSLVASSIIPTGGGCGGKGRGYLNVIDPFTGGSISNSFFDVNGDGRFDGKDGVGGTPAGSIDLGLGMISDPGILVGDLVQGSNPSLACAGGASGATGCVPLNLQGMGPHYGRVSWTELIRD